MEEEWLWIKAIRNGETHYFQNLYNKHRQKIYALCFRFTQNRADAEDQLQEIFLKLLKKVHLFQRQSAFSTWAHRLAVNHLINFLKHRGKRTESAIEDADEHGWDPEPQTELAAALKRAIAELPEGYRRVFLLHDQEGFQHEEIARMIGCNVTTSRSQLCRARLAMREKLQPLLRRSR